MKATRTCTANFFHWPKSQGGRWGSRSSRRYSISQSRSRPFPGPCLLDQTSLRDENPEDLKAIGEASTPKIHLRAVAVHRLLMLERRASPSHPTAAALEEMENWVEPSRSFRDSFLAYRIQRTGQLIGGHKLDSDDEAIRRLGAWTLLGLCWPRLGDDLASHPQRFTALCDDREPPLEFVDEDLAAVYGLGEARTFCAQARTNSTLDADAIQRFTQRPISDGSPAQWR